MKTYGRKSLGKGKYDSTLNFDLICRLCLTEDGEMRDLFQEEDCARIPIPLQIMASVSLAVYENDGLPMQVCQTCIDQVEMSYKFKQKCEESDQQLRKIRNTMRLQEAQEKESFENSAKRIKVESGDNESGTDEETVDDPEARESKKELLQLKQLETQKKIRSSMAELLTVASSTVPPAVASFEIPAEGSRDDSTLQAIECNMVIDLPVVSVPDEVTETIVGLNSIPAINEEDEVEIEQIQIEDVSDQNDDNIQVQLFEEGEEEDGGQGTTIIVNIKKKDSSPRPANQQWREVHVDRVARRRDMPNTRSTDAKAKRDNEETDKLLCPFQCPKCPKRFGKRIDLRRHLSIHQERKGFDCQTCEKWFPNQTTLKRHERSHTGERPYQCDHCQKRFSQAGILQRHIMTHTGEKPFVCDVCQKGFTQREGLKVHARTHEERSQLDIPLHDCPLCDKSFCHPSGLSRHLLIHTGKTFKCQLCSKVFTDPSSLRRHLRRHESDNDSESILS